MIIKEHDILTFKAKSIPVNCGDMGTQHHYEVYLNGDQLISREIVDLLAENAVQEVWIEEWLDGSLLSYSDAFALTGIIDSTLSLKGTLRYSVEGQEDRRAAV